MTAIPDETLWLEIHRVFSGRGVGPDGSLTLKELMDAWPESGLRQNDLAQGLESLGRAGFVRLELSQEGPSVRLLDAQFASASPGTEGPALDLLATLRKPGGDPASHLLERQGEKNGRRIDDGAAYAA